MNDVRLLPVVIVAVGALLGLKAATIGFGGLSVPAAIAQEAEVPADGSAADADAPGEGQAAASPAGSLFGGEEAHSDAREAVMQSLGERRRQLEAREQELQMRENLLAATESRLEERIAELKAIEARIDGVVEARREEDEARFAGLVEMYESMKPKDAAAIFDGLDMPILMRVASRMKARAMSEVMAQMTPQKAQALTVELSNPPAEPEIQLEENGELPKIIGTRPAG